MNNIEIHRFNKMAVSNPAYDSGFNLTQYIIYEK